MKTIILITVTAFFIAKADAAILLVNNNAGGPGQYSVIDSAIVHANAGDTIYVSGSSTTYANCTITKSLTLIGAGTFAQKQNAFPSTIVFFDFNSNVSNVTIEGFNVTNEIRLNNLTNLNHLTFKYNYFSNYGISFYGVSNTSNVLISSNVFNFPTVNFIIDFLLANSLSNFIIENNIISGGIRNMNVVNSLFQNNVFYNTNFNGPDGFSSLSNAMFVNNIFYNVDPSNGVSGSTYNNNITYSTSGTLTALGGTNTDNTNPQFINVATSGGYNSSYNFGIAAASPAHNAGTDGRDMGIYGGSAKVTVTGETYNVSVIRQMLMLNSTVPQNGNLNVKVRSTISRQH